jgi:hypothetical protein
MRNASPHRKTLPRAHWQSGQAAVEAAFTLPLVTFLMLGTMQLFMLMQARLMAQYAVYQAARVGSTTQAHCDAMADASVLVLLPTFVSYLGPAAGFGGLTHPGQSLGAAFNAFKSSGTHGLTAYNTYHTASSAAWGTDEIVWIARERPKFGFGLDNPIIAQQQFDNPVGAGGPVTHIELTMVYWAPLQIPFADWVFERMALAQMGILAYSETASPIQTNQAANWNGTAGSLQAAIANELKARALAQHYVFPIQVNYSMRMMSPVDLKDFPPFQTQNCGNTPNSL